MASSTRKRPVHFHIQLPRSQDALMRETPLVRDFLVTMGGYGRDIQRPFENPYPHGMEDSLFHLQLQAGTWLQIDGVRSAIPQDALMCVPREVPFRWGLETVHLPNVTYWFRARGKAVDLAFSLMGWRPSRPYVILRDPVRFIREHERMTRLMTLPPTRRTLLEMSVIGAQLLTSVVEDADLAIRAPRSSEQRVEEVITSMQETRDWATPLPDSTELASMAGLSVPHFMELFKQRTGYSPHQYLSRLKAQAAAQQLLDRDRSIAEVATGMGFDDPLYFSRWFRKLMGSPPSKFREQARMIR